MTHVCRVCDEWQHIACTKICPAVNGLSARYATQGFWTGAVWFWRRGVMKEGSHEYLHSSWPHPTEQELVYAGRTLVLFWCSHWIPCSAISAYVVSCDRLDQVLQSALIAHLLSLVDYGCHCAGPTKARGSWNNDGGEVVGKHNCQDPPTRARRDEGTLVVTTTGTGLAAMGRLAASCRATSVGN